MFLDAPIDPDVPTDPEELALYRKYGKNWRTILSGTNRRDRGGNLDRGMRFFHTSPEGFLTRPKALSQSTIQNTNIDNSAILMELDRLQKQYDSYLAEYYALQNTPAYDQQQDYYYNNFIDAYGGQGTNTSQNNQYASMPEPPITLLPEPSATPSGPLLAPSMLNTLPSANYSLATSGVPMASRNSVTPNSILMNLLSGASNAAPLTLNNPQYQSAQSNPIRNPTTASAGSGVPVSAPPRAPAVSMGQNPQYGNALPSKVDRNEEIRYTPPKVTKPPKTVSSYKPVKAK